MNDHRKPDEPELYQFNKEQSENRRLPRGRTIAYVRVSTEEQHGGRSYESQINAVSRFVHPTTGVRAHGIVVEQGSGGDPNRPGLRWMLEQYPRGIIAYSVDRLSRNSLHLLMLLECVADRLPPCYVWFVYPTMSHETASGRLFITNLVAFAEFELEQISERTSRGMMAKGGKSHSSLNLRQRIVMLRQKGMTFEEIGEQIGREYHRKRMGKSTVRHLYLQATNPQLLEKKKKSVKLT